jgi:hypothetical protein
VSGSPDEYTSAGTAPDDALAAVRRAQESERPALLVVDDADDAGSELLDRAAAIGRDSSRRRLLLVVLHASRRPAARTEWRLITATHLIKLHRHNVAAAAA